MSARVIEGDAVHQMSEMLEDSVDACVSDPPYGLRFMGRAWDHGVPGEPYWSDVLRVLKPGGYLVAFGGTRTHHRLMCAIEDAGFEIRDCLMWLYGSGFPKGKGCLKPAWEPIILARKPAPGAWLNVDGCRVYAAPSKNDGWRPNSSGITYGDRSPVFSGGSGKGLGEKAYNGDRHPAGRWPANVVLDEEAATALDQMSGTLASGHWPERRSGIGFKGGAAGTVSEGRSRSEGGASRFFYCAKASAAERRAYNDHPTVKPLALMQWLVRLVTPPGGVVLDPFCGSGSTLIAADREGFDAIGIDADPHAVEIARRRLTDDAGPLMSMFLEGAS